MLSPAAYPKEETSAMSRRLIIVMRNRTSLCVLLLICLATSAFCQRKMPGQEPPKNGTKATLVRNANLYVQPDENADRVSIIMPGREMVIAERSGHWLRVFANIDAPESRQSDQPMMEQDQQV